MDGVMDRLVALVVESEDWLVQRVLDYAKQTGYVKYTSTLAEAWRMSIAGLTESLVKAVEVHQSIPELHPDEDFSRDPIASFGKLEAQRHRARGITIEMFLGLMKYYQQSYIDLVMREGYDTEREELYRLYLQRFFDRIEIGFTTEWNLQTESDKLEELRSCNRTVTNEKNKYLTIFESMRDPVVLYDSELRIRNYNHAAATFFVDSPTPGCAYYTDEAPAVELPWLTEIVGDFVASEDETRELERCAMTARGDRIFLVKLTRMLDVSEKFTGIVAMFDDLTERKRLERSMALVQKHEAIGQLAGGIAHEITAPVQSVVGNLGYVRYALEQVESAIAGSCVDEVALSRVVEETLEGMDRIRKIATAVSEFADTESCEREAHDINLAIRHSITVIGSRLNGVADLVLDLDADLPALHCHTGEINQAILSVLINAVQAIEDRCKTQGTDERGRITISSRYRKGVFEIRIADTGLGIPAEHRDRVMNPFFSTREVGMGLGQGLAIARSVVEDRHGGELGFETRQGKGTVFHLRIPGPDAQSCREEECVSVEDAAH